jgi:hypothetical protein
VARRSARNYLETDKAGNVAFYERFGFEVTGGEPVSAVQTWSMRRTSRSD